MKRMIVASEVGTIPLSQYEEVIEVMNDIFNNDALWNKTGIKDEYRPNLLDNELHQVKDGVQLIFYLSRNHNGLDSHTFNKIYKKQIANAVSELSVNLKNIRTQSATSYSSVTRTEHKYVTKITLNLED